MLSAVRKALAEIEAGCGRSRVLVGVSRGLWDKAAAEILAYLVEDCRENSSWRQRLAAGAAVEALGAEFAAQLHRALGHEIKARAVLVPGGRTRTRTRPPRTILFCYSVTLTFPVCAGRRHAPARARQAGQCAAERQPFAVVQHVLSVMPACCLIG